MPDEKYRRARNVDEDYEIRTTEGEWLPVKSSLHIEAPLTLVTFAMDDGSTINCHPNDEIMSRPKSVAVTP